MPPRWTQLVEPPQKNYVDLQVMHADLQEMLEYQRDATFYLVVRSERHSRWESQFVDFVFEPNFQN